MGKGNNTTTTTQQGTTSSAPNPVAMQAYQDILSRAQDTAKTAYQGYGGELVAPINAQQYAGIGAINQNAGYAQPFIGQAAQYANNAAQPLSAADIQRYQNPYTQQVVDAAKAQFNNQNAQQQQQVIGNAGMQGALGGDRVGVAQANLAGQQALAQNPVIAGMYKDSYTQGLGAAERQQQNQANAAYSIGNLGVAGQNAALTGANAMVGAGSLEWQNQQAMDAARYQQFQQQQAFPYQQTQWLAGVGTGVGTNMGGTSYSQGTGTSTPPQPNPWAQYAGVGLAAAGMLLKHGGGVRGYDEGGGVGGTPYSGVGGYIPMMQIAAGKGAPPPPNLNLSAGQSGQNQQQANPLAQANSIMGLAGKNNKPGGLGAGLPWNNLNDADSQSTIQGMLGDLSAPAATGDLGPLYRHGGGIGFAGGGAPEYDFSEAGDPIWSGKETTPQSAYNPRDVGWRPDYPQAGQFTASGDLADSRDKLIALGQSRLPADNTPTVSDAGVVPLPRSRPADAGVGADAPQLAPARPIAGIGAPPPDPSQPQVSSFAPTDTDSAQGINTSETGSGSRTGGFGLGFLNDAQRAGLLSAGFGMLASRSPNLGNAIGEGGLAGLHGYSGQIATEQAQEKQRVSQAQKDREIELHAKQLAQAAENARTRISLDTKKLAQAEQHHQVPPGYRQTADGSLEVVPGGPVDPEVLRKAADAKRGTHGLLSDDTIETMAGQYLAGDKSVMQNLGRGAQGAENIVKLRAEIARQAKEAGLRPDQIATKMADFAGRTAAMRTLGTRGVNVEYAANTANRAIDLAEKASDKVPRTMFVPFNRLKQLVDTNTSSPEQAAFYAATNTLVNEYARVASGGSSQATEGMRHHAREMLNNAMGPEAYRAVLNMMRQEIQQAKAAYTETRQEFLRDHSETAAPGAAHAAPATGAPAPAPALRTVNTKAEYDALPSGASFIGSDGKPYRKP